VKDTRPGPRTRPAPAARGAGGAGDRFDLVDGFRLRVIAGPDEGATLVAKRPRVMVGTHPSCDLILADPTVSRFHLEIGRAPDGRVSVRDLDSTNGTTVDGVAVTGAFLAPGAVLGAGGSRVRFERADDAVKVPTSTRTRFGVMVGAAPAMARLFALLERAAASDATVLLEGETGTGKEAAAESIHRESARSGGPFVVVDCGAIPPDLLESELFGHERGAFTGAVAAREGAFEAASGGTLFLDEIGELGAELQPKLLRALEKREVKRVGRSRYAPVDVRVVAATNRNLRVEVNAGRFRSDLYYRLAVLEVRLPPLRERLEDLPLLVERLLEGLGAAGAGRAAAGLRTPAFLAELARHAWPGNVRELRNYLERCVALEAAAPIEPGVQGPGAAPEVDLSRPLREAREAWLRPFERRYLEGLLARHEGNITAAARAAGVDRITFYRLLWRHGLKR
jgi:DNA-binding NtrC family response regulator